MTRLRDRARALWRVLWHSQRLEADMRDEMHFHLEMEARRLAREQGLDRDEARRQAGVRFGGIEKYKEAARDARGRQWIDALSLDIRLGIRMLFKYRGLTLIGGFAMAVAIAIGATAFEVLEEMIAPGLPFDEGERVVSLQYSATNPANRERKLLGDFAIWRESLTSLEQLAAWRSVQQNLVSPEAAPEPIKAAEMTASGFTVARTPPHLGRYLLPADEQIGAAPVVVIGYRAWQSRFAADPQIVGRLLNLGGTQHSVVGVMPEGFGFPFDHQFWLPFRATPLAYERSRGPTIYVFGRLARGVTIEQTQAELSAIGQRPAADRPDGAEPLPPLIVPYTRDHVDLAQPGMVSLVRIAQILTGALTFVVAINLAILVYARTVTRLGEIAVRTALGASRRRILMQLFLEALALSLLGAASGLAASAAVLRYIQAFARANGGVPFWIKFDLSPATVIDALAMAVVAAVIMGVVPGLKATGRGLTAALHEWNSRTGTRLGAVWSTLVVAQVTVAVAVLPIAFYLAWNLLQLELGGPGFAAERYAITRLALPDAAPVDPDHFSRRQLEMMARLQAEPGASAVTFSSYVPGFAGGARVQFEDGVAATVPPPWDVSRLDVAVEMFDVYDAEIVAGRGFVAGDVGVANAAIVNQTFAQWLRGNSGALGVRFRYDAGAGATREHGEWHQIVGVVRDFPRFPSMLNLDTPAVVYHASVAGVSNPVFLSARFDGGVPAGFENRVRQIAAEVDPALQVQRALPLSEFYDDVRSLWRYITWGIGVATISVLLLSAAGMHALMSFTVAQRTREIGIRLALGAHPRRLLVSVFGRVLRQLAIGIGAGSLVSAVLISTADLSLGPATSILLAVAGVMLIVGVAAALGPARRSLSVQASEALRADA